MFGLKTRLAVILSLIFSLLGCEKKLSQEDINQLYEKPTPPPQNKQNVFHLGHSLVNRDMPLMLRQLAGGNHDFKSQLGWGTTLKAHWDPDIAINGFELENDHSDYRDVFDAIESGEFNSFVFTEMVEIKDAIKYFDTAKYLAKFARKAKANNPRARMYLYETWHRTDDPAGWMYRLDDDYNKHWKKQILFKTLAILDGDVPIYIIPVGQVFSKFFKQLEIQGGVEGIRHHEDIFLTKDDGSKDTIHLNDIGNYFVSLVHYSVIYQKNPSNLPFQLIKADGTKYLAPSKEAAELMQKITWDVVSKEMLTGIMNN